jgi:hypothetical protein
MMTKWKTTLSLIFITLIALISPADAKFYSNDDVDAVTHIKQNNVQGFNRYTYANNNPYKYVDPDGRTGKLANLVVKLVKNRGNPKSAGKEFIEDAVDSFSTLADPNSSGFEKAEAVFNLLSPIGTNDLPGNKNGKIIKAGIDNTGKMHGDLPDIKDLKQLDSQTLADFRDDLKTSLKERKRVSKDLGADAGHSRRENAESDLAKQLDKHLGNK